MAEMEDDKMQHIDTAMQSGGGGFGAGGHDPLMWLTTLAFLGDGFGGNRGRGRGDFDGGFGGGGHGVAHHNLHDVHHFERLAEQSGKIDCLQTGQESIRADLRAENLDRGISELAGISRDINDSVFRESSAASRQLAECCCDLLAGQESIKTSVAIQTRDLTSNNDQNTQRLLDKLCENEVQGLLTSNASLRAELSEARIIQACDDKRGH